MGKRNYLWKVFKHDRSTDENYNSYKAQRNVCTSLRRKNDQRLSINGLRKQIRFLAISGTPIGHFSMPNVRSKQTTVCSNSKIKLEQINLKLHISIFNIYFINIADHIEVPRCTSSGFDYEEHPSVRARKEQQESSHTLLFSFSFSHTSPRTIEQSLKEIKTNNKNNKSPKHENRSPRLLKSAGVIAAPSSALSIQPYNPVQVPSNRKKEQVYRGGGAVQKVGRGGAEAGGRDEWGGIRCVFDKEYQSAPVNCKADWLSAFCASRTKCLPFAQYTTKQRYLSRKTTMGIFGLYERSHIKRY